MLVVEGTLLHVAGIIWPRQENKLTTNSLLILDKLDTRIVMSLKERNKYRPIRLFGPSD
jgi:hypothetical protein